MAQTSQTANTNPTYNVFAEISYTLFNLPKVWDCGRICARKKILISESQWDHLANYIYICFLLLALVSISNVRTSLFFSISDLHITTKEILISPYWRQTFSPSCSVHCNDGGSGAWNECTHVHFSHYILVYSVRCLKNHAHQQKKNQIISPKRRS